MLVRSHLHVQVCVCVFAAFFTSHGWDWFIPVTGFDEAFPSAHLRAVRNAVALKLTSQAIKLGSPWFMALPSCMA
jgi:hypothetical protein